MNLVGSLFRQCGYNFVGCTASRTTNQNSRNLITNHHQTYIHRLQKYIDRWITLTLRVSQGKSKSMQIVRKAHTNRLIRYIVCPKRVDKNLGRHFLDMQLQTTKPNGNIKPPATRPESRGWNSDSEGKC